MGGKEELVQLGTQEGWGGLRVQAEPLMQEEWGAQQELVGQVGQAYSKELRQEAVEVVLLPWAVLPP